MRGHSLAFWFWAGAAALMVLFAIWALTPRPREVDEAIVDRGLVQVTVADEGRSRVHDVFVVSAPRAGVLRRVLVESGDAVAGGAVVARIAPEHPTMLDVRTRREMRAEIDAARAALQAMEAQAIIAADAQRRTQALAAKNFAAEAALSRDNAALRAAQANVAAAKARVRQAEAALADPKDAGDETTPVRAPAAGKVLRVLQESETIVAPGAPILEIGDPESDLEVIAEFLSQDAVRMHAGMAAAIENWGGEQTLPATVERIEPYARTKTSALGVEEQRVNVVLKLAPDARSAGLGHGFRVDARVILAETKDAVRVPTDALVRRGTDWAVFRIVDGKARLTTVTLAEGDAAYRPALSGIKAGEAVVLFPPDTLADGETVKPRAKVGSAGKTTGTR